MPTQPMQLDMVPEDSYEILDAIVRATGGYQTVAEALWPSLKRDTAYQRLKQCINREKDAKLSEEERDWLFDRARDHDYHEAMKAWCRLRGYSEPLPVSKDDQQAEIALQMERAARLYSDAAKRFERLLGAGTAADVRRLHSK